MSAASPQGEAHGCAEYYPLIQSYGLLRNFSNCAKAQPWIPACAGMTANANYQLKDFSNPNTKTLRLNSCRVSY
jgi:hypothetical protein